MFIENGDALDPETIPRETKLEWAVGIKKKKKNVGQKPRQEVSMSNVLSKDFHISFNFTF